MFPVNAPNLLTVVRILLVPVLVVALLDKTPSGDLLAAIAFTVASLTDAADGYLARSRGSVTTFGKLMDPVADKLLIIAALIALVSLHRLAGWVAMVIIAREFAVTATRMAATQQGVVIAANWWGKTKTIVQVAAIFFLIAFDPSPWWVEALVYGAVAITVVSGIDYFFGMRRLLREAEERRRHAAPPDSAAATASASERSPAR
ncbi:MAG TPA: CDP-diacylglycerol--glycerol-3-phosphate 3-phosphatidyltransferase [Solirubrobacteraceae bacterium]|nr:CDP-diacylglycerol--glycerol-3-phosphate 3-phosphatidyltransferase [Solirubrobacteraceae bacterium]